MLSVRHVVSVKQLTKIGYTLHCGSWLDAVWQNDLKTIQSISSGKDANLRDKIMLNQVLLMQLLMDSS